MNEFSGTVTPISIATGTAGRPIRVGGMPCQIAITPDGRTAYVVNGNRTGSLMPIDTATGAVGTAINAGEFSDLVTISPDGTTAYVAAFTGRGPILTGIVTPVSLPSGTPGTPVILGGRTGATGIAITPDGSAAYVAALAITPHMPGIVVRINTRTGTAGQVIRVGNEPLGIAITPCPGCNARVSGPVRERPGSRRAHPGSRGPPW